MSTPRWEPTSDTPYLSGSSSHPDGSSARPISPAWDPACDLSYLANLSSHPAGSPEGPPTSTFSSGSTPKPAEPSYEARVSDLKMRLANLTAINVNPSGPLKHQRLAMWHPQSGLFVSPNATYIPKMEEYTIPKPNWTIPRLLPDDEIYLAFRPRIIRNSGALFGRLNLTRSTLAKAILTVKDGYVLDACIMESWIRLENALLDLGKSLLPKSGIPLITYPKFPYEYGYRQSHRARDAALRCALRSRDAFVELSSLVSLIIALNMDNSGSYEAAFYKLRTRHHEPVHSAWLDQLKISQVCDFSDNFRVGVVVNPYSCHWAPYLDRFGFAHVPIWIFWGHHFKSTPLVHESLEYFFPPDEFVEKAIDIAKKSGNLIVPSYRFDPVALSASPWELGSDDFASAPNLPESSWADSPMRISPPPPDAPLAPSLRHVSSSADVLQPWAAHDLSAAPQVPDSSNTVADKAKALAALEEFFAKRREMLERRIATETDRERQACLGREANAKSRVNYSRRSKVYEWVDLGNGVYERVALESKQAAVNWSNFSKNQRRYTSYNDQWDLCPQLPRYTDEFPEEDDQNSSDFDDGFESDGSDFVPMGKRIPSTLAIPNDGHTANTLLDLRTTLHLPGTAVDDADALPPPLTEVFDLAPFLRDRLGYDLSTKWSVQADKRFEDMPPPPTSSSSRWDKGKARRRNDTPPPRTSSSSHRNKGKAPNNKGKAKEAESAEGDTILSLSKALMSLSFHEVELDTSAEAGIINLVNTLSSAKGTFADLPPNFDHSAANSTRLSLSSDTLELCVASSSTPPVYLLRNSGGSLRTDPWMIATRDASTVLLVFRKKWPSVDIIARELVQRGARFNTVKAVANRPQPALLQVRPLGIRLKGYTPSREDYEEYVRRRNDLLRGPKGRAALMHGGIISRIARDILPEHGVVLDGPISGDHVVCEYDNLFLVDDQLTETDKNIICGVYFAQTEQSPEGEKLVDGATLELSWFPQDSLWNSMGCYLRTEWTDLAEVYYKKRGNYLQSKLTILNATEWRKSLRKANTWTKKIEAGVEHYQRGYLTHQHQESILRADHP